MQVIEDTNTSKYQIRAYKPGEITINNEVYTSSVIVTPDTLIINWNPRSAGEVTQKDIEQILDLKTDIILLGTGNKLIRPTLTEKNIDWMDTAAACRTFVALSSEGRNVAAALIINPKENT